MRIDMRASIKDGIPIKVNALKRAKFIKEGVFLFFADEKDGQSSVVFSHEVIPISWVSQFPFVQGFVANKASEFGIVGLHKILGIGFTLHLAHCEDSRNLGNVMGILAITVQLGWWRSR